MKGLCSLYFMGLPLLQEKTQSNGWKGRKVGDPPPEKNAFESSSSPGSDQPRENFPVFLRQAESNRSHLNTKV